MTRLLYLASPYSSSDSGIREERFELVCEAAAYLLRAGVMVYSPIAHTHPIAQHGALPTGWDFWKRYDTLFLDRCDGMIVLMLPGWATSVGVSDEIAIMREQGKPIAYVEMEDLRDNPGLMIATLNFMQMENAR